MGVCVSQQLNPHALSLAYFIFRQGGGTWPPVHSFVHVTLTHDSKHQHWLRSGQVLLLFVSSGMEREITWFEVGSAAIQLLVLWPAGVFWKWKLYVKSLNISARTPCFPFYLHIACMACHLLWGFSRLFMKFSRRKCHFLSVLQPKTEFNWCHSLGGWFVPPIRPRDRGSWQFKRQHRPRWPWPELGSTLKNPPSLQVFRIPSFFISSIFCPSFSEETCLELHLAELTATCEIINLLLLSPWRY